MPPFASVILKALTLQVVIEIILQGEDLPLKVIYLKKTRAVSIKKK